MASTSTIESLAKSLGVFAAYYAIFESFVGYTQPYGTETLEQELGPYYNWFIAQQSYLMAHLPDQITASDWMSTTSGQAQVVAILEFAVALPVVVAPRGSSIHLAGLCLLSWYYMSAVRGHLALRTTYVPAAMTMFGFSHVALLTHLLGAIIPSTPSGETPGVEIIESNNTSTDEKIKTTEKAQTTAKKRTNKNKK